MCVDYVYKMLLTLTNLNYPFINHLPSDTKSSMYIYHTIRQGVTGLYYSCATSIYDAAGLRMLVLQLRIINIRCGGAVYACITAAHHQYTMRRGCVCLYYCCTPSLYDAAGLRMLVLLPYIINIRCGGAVYACITAVHHQYKMRRGCVC